MFSCNYLSQRIRQRRTQLGLTQEYVANSLGISLSHYGNIERGDRCATLQLLVGFANIMGCDANYFLQDYIEILQKRAAANPNIRHFLLQDMKELEPDDNSSEPQND